MVNTSVFSDAAWYLEEWAKWARSNSGVVKGYPRNPSFANAISATTGGYLISDDDAMLVDGALAELRIRDEPTGDITALYYLSGKNLSRIAQETKINRMKAKVLVEVGTAHIEALVAPQLKSKIY